MRNVSTRPLLWLPSRVSPVSRSRFGMSSVVSGSVHSIMRISPAAILARSLRVFKAGSGHFSPRILIASAAGLAALARLDAGLGAGLGARLGLFFPALD